MRLALIGEYSDSFEPHIQTTVAIEHSARHLGIEVNAVWISTADLSQQTFADFQAIWIAPGSPYKDFLKTLWAIQYARENGIPCLGTCGGFQHMVIEYARNVLELRDAEHAEYDPYAKRLIISRLTCSLVGKELPIRFTEGSKIAQFYGATKATERYYCNFGINPAAVPSLMNDEFRPVAFDDDGEVRAMEISTHPFFIGTLYVPQALSTFENSHPLVTEFLRVVHDPAFEKKRIKIFEVYRNRQRLGFATSYAELTERFQSEFNSQACEIRETETEVGLIDTVVQNWGDDLWIIRVTCPKCLKQNLSHQWTESTPNPVCWYSGCRCVDKWLISWKKEP